MRQVNNYFKVYCADPMLGIFPFDGKDALSIQRAWDLAEAFRTFMVQAEEPLRGDMDGWRERVSAQKVVSVWLPVAVRGPWSVAKQIGVSSGGVS